MSGENPASTTEYIQHHLQILVYGKLLAGFERHTENGVEALGADTWTMAHGASELPRWGSWLFMLTPWLGPSLYTYLTLPTNNPL